MLDWMIFFSQNSILTAVSPWLGLAGKAIKPNWIEVRM